MLPFVVPEFLAWIVLPAFIFVARILDVSLGTIRIIFIARGFKYYAPIIGFFEVLIWLFAISTIMQNLNNLFLFVVYAAGFASGTFVGILLEERLSLGTSIVRVITRYNSKELVEKLQAAGFEVTSIDAEGPKGGVKIVLTVTKRHSLKEAEGIIKSCRPNAFYYIEDVRSAAESAAMPKKQGGLFQHIFPSKKAK